MSKAEKENRINSLAVSFLERQQITPHPLADQIISAYKEGYFQAEKDLSDISWIKEVSGVKEMSRAKEEALKAYPPQSIAANYDTINRRDAFEYGYLKAEKDLELTCDDICEIIEIREDVLEMDSYENLYEEILKRFKERKETKD